MDHVQSVDLKAVAWFLALGLLAASALTMAVFVAMPWLVLVGMGLLWGQAVLIALRERVSKWELALGWISTLVVWRSLLLGDVVVFTLDNYYAVFGWLVAGMILLAGQRVPDSSLKAHWRLLGMTWAFMAGLIWLLAAYLMNLAIAFHAGVLVALALLVLCRCLFRLSGLGVQAVNTLILLLVALPVTDALVRPSYRMDERPETGERYYSYEVARRNPTAFARWWYHFVRLWEVAKPDLFDPDPEGAAPFLLRPGSRTLMFESTISINRLGFRGPEFDFEKGNAYRIVALGESTTFGHTLRADDVPWPELLQRFIEERLRPDRPVQVINAGVPSYTLLINLHRLDREILPLKPDMIISYHGYNGFMWLDPALPPIRGQRPPAYEHRPLKLLADCEYRLKLAAYKQSQIARKPAVEQPASEPMDTAYARAYQRLIEVARARKIELVLANFSMAVNNRSDPEVVAFYRAAFPMVLSQIRANHIHSHIIEQLEREHPGLHVVDTHPDLDGNYEKFIDLVHFTQQGREQLAETLFAGIRPILERDLIRRDPQANRSGTSTAAEEPGQEASPPR